jgi:hypothetical protein
VNESDVWDDIAPTTPVIPTATCVTCGSCFRLSTEVIWGTTFVRVRAVCDCTDPTNRRT